MNIQLETSPTTGQTWYIQNGAEPYIELGRVAGQPGQHVLQARDGTRRLVGGYYLRQKDEDWDDVMADTEVES